MSPVAILGVGASTPIGHDARSSWSSFRAGIVRFFDLEGSAGIPARASYLDLIPWGTPRAERAAVLAQRALTDLTSSCMMDLPSELPMWIGVAETDPGDPVTAIEQALSELLRSELPQLATPPTFLRYGRSAFFHALAEANAALTSRACEVALVGAVDSLCAPKPLQRLAKQRRLLGPDTEGVVPGEGAAFILLARSDFAARTRQPGHATLLCSTTRLESRHYLQSAPNTADALTVVLQTLQVHPATRNRRTDLFLTCETGEPFWTAELSMAYFRSTALMPEPFVRRMAAEGFGDLGAAAGGVMTAIGIHGLARPRRSAPPWTAPPLLLVCGSSDSGQVGACLIEGRVTEGGP